MARADLSLAMFYNNVLSIPILLFASLFLENWSSENVEKNFPAAQRNNIIAAMVFSGLLIGAMLPYAFSAMTMKSVGRAALEMVKRPFPHQNSFFI